MKRRCCALVLSCVFATSCADASESKQKLDDKHCETVRDYYPKLAHEFAEFLQKKLPTHPKYKMHIKTYLEDIDRWQSAFRMCFEKKIDP